MMKVSRGALAAIAAAVAIPAGVALARGYDHGGWQRMSPETRARLDEGRIAMAKTALKLNPDQEKLWAAVETELRAGMKVRADHMAERQKMWEERRAERDAKADGAKDGKPADKKRMDMGERIEKMSQRMSERAERMKSFATAFKPFYASLSDEQKEVLRPLMREMMGGRGHGEHGKRWAMGGGWGEGGRGHHEGGRHGGGWHGRHGPGGPEGPGFRDERGGGGMDDGERGPPAEQLMPEADDASPVAPDKL